MSELSNGKNRDFSSYKIKIYNGEARASLDFADKKVM